MTSDGHLSVDPAARPSVSEAVRRVAYLDRALWNRLSEAGSPEELAEFWLVLQCRMIEGVARAGLFLEREGSGGLRLVSHWPEGGGDGPTSLLTTARRALEEEKGVVSGHRKEGAAQGHLCCTAYPFIVDGEPRGAVALEVADRSAEELRAVMRQLQWGAAWLELAWRRQEGQATAHSLNKTSAALDLIALLIEQKSYGGACKAVVTELATRLNCELVGLGMLSGQRMKVAALSHSTQFGRRMNLVQAMAAAMEEASDQECAVLFPGPEDGDYHIILAHRELAGLLDDASVLTVPLLQDDKPLGALLFQRTGQLPFDQDAVDLCDAIAAAVGPLLEEKRRNDRLLVFKTWDSLVAQTRRLFGAHYLGRKLAFGIIALLVVFFAFYKDDYRVTADARVEGRIQRVLVAPFDGYIASQAARAGDQVSSGTVLATLDDRDLSLEHLRWTTTRQQRQAEYDQALANRDRAGINIVRAQIQQAEAQIALIEEQLARTRLVAAFDGVIVAGDLSQSVGSAVKRGEELFRIAPLDSYRVILEVDESRVTEIAPGQKGELKVAALLDRTLPYTIERITPITEAREGRNVFRVEAVLGERSEGLRPGMEGVAKTDAGRRLLIQIWTQELVHWLRLKLWAWWP